LWQKEKSLGTNSTARKTKTSACSAPAAEGQLAPNCWKANCWHQCERFHLMHDDACHFAFVAALVILAYFRIFCISMRYLNVY
jgi:hypothetical protein